MNLRRYITIYVVLFLLLGSLIPVSLSTVIDDDNSSEESTAPQVMMEDSSGYFYTMWSDCDDEMYLYLRRSSLPNDTTLWETTVLLVGLGGIVWPGVGGGPGIAFNAVLRDDRIYLMFQNWSGGGYFHFSICKDLGLYDVSGGWEGLENSQAQTDNTGFVGKVIFSIDYRYVPTMEVSFPLTVHIFASSNPDKDLGYINGSGDPTFTWDISGPRVLHAGLTDTMHIHAAVDENNSVYVVYVNGTDVYFRKSTDGGLNFGALATPSNPATFDTLDSGFGEAPLSIGARTDISYNYTSDIMVVWTENRSSATDIMYKTSDGTSWGSEGEVYRETAPGIMPALSGVDGMGNWYCFFCVDLDPIGNIVLVYKAWSNRTKGFGDLMEDVPTADDSYYPAPLYRINRAATVAVYAFVNVTGGMVIVESFTIESYGFDVKVVNKNTTMGFEDIQSAIDEVTTVNGNVLQVYNGTFIEDVNVTKEIEIYGSSSLGVVVSQSTWNITANNVIIRMMVLNGTSVNVTGMNVEIRYVVVRNNTGYAFVLGNASPYLRDVNVNLTGSSTGGILVAENISAFIYNSTISTAGYRGDINITASGAVVTMVNCSFDTTKIAVGSILYVKAFFDVEIEDEDGLWVNSTYPNGSVLGQLATRNGGRTDDYYHEYFWYMESPDGVFTYYHPYNVTAQVPTWWKSGYYYVRDKDNNTVMPHTGGSIRFTGYGGRGYEVSDNVTIVQGTPVPFTGDWIIGNYTVAENGTAWVNGNITINSTGTLVLNNAALVINSTYNQTFAIYVNGTCLINDSLITFGIDGVSVIMRVYNSSTNWTQITYTTFNYASIWSSEENLTIQDSIFSLSGWDYRIAGVAIDIENGGLILENTTISGNSIGLRVYNGTATVNSCTFRSSHVYGIETNDSTAILYANIISDSGGGVYGRYSIVRSTSDTFNDISGIAVRGGDSSTFTYTTTSMARNGVSFFMSGQSLEVTSATITGTVGTAGRDIYLLDGSYWFNSSSIGLSKDFGLYLYNTTTYMRNCSASERGEFAEIDANVNLYLRGTPHERSYVFLENDSRVYVDWYLSVQVINGSNPVSGALVTLDNYWATEVLNLTTGSDGWIKGYILREGWHNGTTSNYSTPHRNLLVEKAAAQRSARKVGVRENRQIVIDLGGTYRTSLSPGWNLVSFPVEFSSAYRMSDLVDELDVQSVDIQAIVTRLSGGRYKGIYWTGTGWLGEDLVVNSTSGYYIYAGQPSTVDIRGIHLLEDSIPLEVGWNMVPIYYGSNVGDLEREIGDPLESIVIRGGQARYRTYDFGSGTGDITRSYSLHRGMAVYVYVTETLVWRPEL